jgi:hypothetical protein
MLSILRKINLLLFTNLLLVSSSMYASVETLPKGVFMFSTEYEGINMNKVGAETVNSTTLKGNSDFKFVDITDYKASNIESLYPLIAGSLMSADTKLVDSYTLRAQYFHFGYGITNKLSVSLKAPYFFDELKYNQEYIDSITFINGLDDSLVIVPPKTAKNNKFADMTLNFKYRISERFAAATSIKAGPLKVGTNATDTTVKDGEEELSSGGVEDYYTFALMYDQPLKKHSLSFTAAYRYSTEGHEKWLDNDFDVNYGNNIFLTAESNFKINKKLNLGTKLTYQQAGTDQKKVDNKWEDIESTEVQAILAKLSLTYKPVEFIDTWIGYEVPLKNTVAGGAYEYPGRLNAEHVITFGATFYYANKKTRDRLKNI